MLRAVLLALLLSASSAFVPQQASRLVRSAPIARATEEVETVEEVAEPVAEAPAPAPAPEPAAPEKPKVRGQMITSLPEGTTGSAIADSIKSQIAEKDARISKLPGIETRDDLKELATTLCPAVPFWDPLGLSDGGFWNEPEVATIGFLRQAEIKHGRVAMAGFVGFIVHAQGYKWGFPMTLAGDPWPSADSVPGLWDALPQAAKWQIILFVGALEWYDEYHFNTPNKPAHYMRGGLPGKYPAFEKPLPWNLYDPFNFSGKRTEEQKARGRLAEINNGRLAMIGLMGFLAESRVPGSVPVLKGLIAPYSGNVMVPFEGQFSLFGSA